MTSLCKPLLMLLAALVLSSNAAMRPKLRPPSFGEFNAVGKSGGAWDEAKGKAEDMKYCEDKVATECDIDSRCGLIGKKCVPTALATRASGDISAGSSTLEMLGDDMITIMTGIFAQGMIVGDRVKDLTPADLKGIAAALGEELATGAKMPKNVVKDLVAKMKDPDAFGPAGAWGVEEISQMGPLLKGLPASDLGAITEENFAVTMNKFGETDTWTKEQSGTLAHKLVGLYGSAQALTEDALKASEGFLDGLSVEDLRMIPSAAFREARDAFKANMGKGGAFSEEQKHALKDKLKAEMQNEGLDLASLSRQKAADYGPLLGTLDDADLGQLPPTAVSGFDRKTVKAIGGRKAQAAFSVDHIKSMSSDARKGFNGDDLKEFAGNRTKVKAILGCDTDPSKCPGALTDFTTTYDSGEKSELEVGDDIKAALRTQKGMDFHECAGGATKNCVEIMMTRSSIDDSVFRRSTTPGDTQTVTRYYTMDEASANRVGSVVGQGTTTVVAVDGSAGGPGPMPGSAGCSYEASVTACRVARGAYGWTCGNLADQMAMLGPSFCGPSTRWDQTSQKCVPV